jgi:hypothetical protein
MLDKFYILKPFKIQAWPCPYYNPTCPVIMVGRDPASDECSIFGRLLDNWMFRQLAPFAWIVTWRKLGCLVAPLLSSFLLLAELVFWVIGCWSLGPLSLSLGLLLGRSFIALIIGCLVACRLPTPPLRIPTLAPCWEAAVWGELQFQGWTCQKYYAGQVLYHQTFQDPGMTGLPRLQSYMSHHQIAPDPAIVTDTLSAFLRSWTLALVTTVFAWLARLWWESLEDASMVVTNADLVGALMSSRLVSHGRSSILD